MDNNSVKKTIINVLATIPNIDIPEIKNLETNKLYLLTSIGMVTGCPISLKTLKQNTPSSIIFKSAFTAFDTVMSERKVPDSDEKFILLKDVTVSNGTFNFTFEYLVVFVDQIIGATIGRVASNSNM